MIYQKDSSKAEEFIHHEEILDTLEYAQNNKDNRVLIEQLIEKAALCKGLTHREAAVLLECDQPDLIEHIFHLAKEIKQKFYGNRIVMFAPLYLSNYCVNGCVYCPYHAKNKTIVRKKLTQEEIRREVIAFTSTLVGESADSMIFFPVAFGGLMPAGELIKMMVIQAVLKTLYEIIILPVTIRVVNYIKKVDGSDVFDEHISYNVLKIKEL